MAQDWEQALYAELRGIRDVADQKFERHSDRLRGLEAQIGGMTEGAIQQARDIDDLEGNLRDMKWMLRITTVLVLVNTALIGWFIYILVNLG